MNFIGYLFIMALVLLLGVFFAVSIHLDIKRIKKNFERAVKEAELDCCNLITRNSEREGGCDI